MWTIVDSPVGALRITEREGAVTNLDFLGHIDTDPSGRASTALHAARAGGGSPDERSDDEAVLVEAARQLRAYFSRDLKEFDLPLAPVGTPFQLRVWEQLRSIGYGEVASYGEVAARLGMTGHGARAVGLANGRNPIAIVVPCHRVVGADGRLVGYGGGVDRKRVLLDLERAGLF